MSDEVRVGLTVDTTQAEMSLEDIKKRADELTRDMKIQRNTLLRQIREGFTMLSSLMSSARQAFSLLGAQMDPFFSALIGMVLATASMLISSATTLALTGIGGVAAAIIFGLAVSFQILTIGKLVADKEQSDGILTSMIQAVSAAAEKRAWGEGF